MDVAWLAVRSRTKTENINKVCGFLSTSRAEEQCFESSYYLYHIFYQHVHKAALACSTYLMVRGERYQLYLTRCHFYLLV